MNVLLVYFAIPVATIILSAIFETFINCPIKVAGIFFSIFIVVSAALGGAIELFFATIIYTIISFITAFIVCLILGRCRYNCYFGKFNNNSGDILTDDYSEKCDCNHEVSLENTNDITEKNRYYNGKYR